MEFLSEQFLEKYKNIEPPFTPIGSFVYYRTYSRWIESENRREHWWETVKRAVNYNIGLENEYIVLDQVKEAEELFDNIFNLRQFPSGRTLWVGGTESSQKFPSSNFNCSFTVINSLNCFIELFHMLLVGAGVGFRILPEDVITIPELRTDMILTLKPYHKLQKKSRHDLTLLEIEESTSTAIIKVGDSKIGWTMALSFMLELMSSFVYRDIENIVVNFDSVRPKGERLKKFGGTASGHESLENMFKKIMKVIVKSGGKLQPIHCLDICNIIGENVVVGGVRRTSQLSLFSLDSTDVLNAKQEIYSMDQDTKEWSINEDLLHRRMSNNTAIIDEKPHRELLHSLIESIKLTGEPGFLNRKEAIRRRSDFMGVNPCCEILLSNKGVCNLTTVNVLAFVKDDNTIDFQGLFHAFRLSARMGLRMTLVDLEIPEWNAQHHKDRLLGCSLTGWQDMKELTGMSNTEECMLLTELKKVVLCSAEIYAKELGINTPLMATTCKPEGTLSLLPTVSSGVHYSYSPYYIRRVRVNAIDPLVKVMEKLGYSICAETGQDIKTCNTKVIEFPMKSPAKRTRVEVSAIEQLENYKRFMTHYVEHNCSITVTVKEDEWDSVEEWVWNNWYCIVGISFLSIDTTTYPLMPYEKITEEEYEDMMKKIKPFNPELLKQFEQQQEDIEEVEEVGGCDGNICPIR